MIERSESMSGAGEAGANLSDLLCAALFVQTNGCYAGLPGVDAWPEH